MIKPGQSFEVYELLPEINAFLRTNGKTPRADRQKMEMGLAFLTDVTEILNGLNLQLRGKGKLICDTYFHVKAFEVNQYCLLCKNKTSPVALQLEACQLRN